MPQLKTVGKDAFSSCKALTSVTFSTLELCQRTFPTNTSICKSPF
jgi:hypothetical protein